MKNIQLPIFLKTVGRNKLMTYGILVAVILLLFGVVGLSILLNGGSSTSPIVTTKLRAALLTYKRTVIIVGANPSLTPVGSGGLPTTIVSPTTGSSSGTNGENNNEPTATPEGEVIFDNMTPTVGDLQDISTGEEVIADGSITETNAPTSTKQLPETGNVQYPIILFISASVFLFISFLF